jgi:hypothetical protein
MKTIKESRSFIIDYKVITEEDIKTLSKYFIKQTSEILVKSKEIKRNELLDKKYGDDLIEEITNQLGYFKVEITSSDNASYTGLVEDLIEQDNILENKNITEISMLFSESIFDSLISVKLRHSDYQSSYVVVEGKDRTWVNGTTKIFQDIFHDCKNQPKIVRKAQWIVIIITISLLNFFSLNLIEFIINKVFIISNPKMLPFNIYSDWTAIIFFLSISLITMFPAISLYQWLENLWPKVEIQTGKDFLKVEKTKRNKLWMILSVIIIPFLISFLFRLI